MEGKHSYIEPEIDRLKELRNREIEDKKIELFTDQSKIVL